MKSGLLLWRSSVVIFVLLVFMLVLWPMPGKYAISATLDSTYLFELLITL